MYKLVVFFFISAFYSTHIYAADPKIVAETSCNNAIQPPFQSGVWFDGENITVNYYSGDGDEYLSPMLAHADISDYVFVQQELPDLRGTNNSIHSADEFSSWPKFNGTWTMPVFITSGSATPDSALRSAFHHDTLDEYQEYSAGHPLSNAEYPVSYSFPTIAVDEYGTTWFGGRNNTTNQIEVNHVNEFFQLEGTLTTTILDTDPSVGAVQIIPLENKNVGFVYGVASGTLFYREFDRETQQFSTAVQINTGYNFSPDAGLNFRAVATRAGNIFVAWHDTAKTVVYRVYDGSAWGTVGTLTSDLPLDLVTGGFTTSAITGRENMVAIATTTSTGIDYKTWDDGVMSSPTEVLAGRFWNGTNAGHIQAPFFDSQKFVIAYIDFANGLLKTHDIDIPPIGTPVRNTTLLSTFGAHFEATYRGHHSATRGKNSLHQFIGKDMRSYVVYENDGVFSSPVAWSKRYFDGHNQSIIAISPAGYVYLAEGGRAAAKVKNHIKIFRSPVTIDDPAFESKLEQSQWIEISPPEQKQFTTGRGYKEMLIDRNETLYVMTASGYGKLTQWYVREYRPDIYTVDSIAYGVATTSVSSSGHGLKTGDSVYFVRTVGGDELIGRSYTITRIDDDQYTLDELDGVDTTTYTAFSSGKAVYVGSAGWPNPISVVSFAKDGVVSYHGGFILDEDEGQETIHMTFSYFNNKTMPYLENGPVLQRGLWYINLLPDGKGGITGRKADKTTAIPLPATEKTMEVIEFDPNDHYINMQGGLTVLDDGYPVAIGYRRQNVAPYKLTELVSWKYNTETSDWTPVVMDDGGSDEGFPWNTLPIIINSERGLCAVSLRTVNGINQAVVYYSENGGDTWLPGVVSTDAAHHVGFPVLAKRSKSFHNLMFHVRNAFDYSDVRLKLLPTSVESDRPEI